MNFDRNFLKFPKQSVQPLLDNPTWESLATRYSAEMIDLDSHNPNDLPGSASVFYVEVRPTHSLAVEYIFACLMMHLFTQPTPTMGRT